MHELGVLWSSAWRLALAWADANRSASWALSACIGLAMPLPWAWLQWQARQENQDRVAEHTAQWRDLAQLEQRNAQLRQQLKAVPSHRTDPDPLVRLSEGARAAGLQTSGLTVGKPERVASSAEHTWQQRPVSVSVQGQGTAWQLWVARWPEQLSGATLRTLDLQVQPDGTVSAQLALMLAQPTNPQAETAPVDASASGATWVSTQHQHAQQHPSFAPWMGDELRRPRQPLEAFALAHVRYIGHMTQAGRKLALVRVADPAQPTHGQVHTVAVGSYLGQDLGRVEAVDTEQLRLRELVRDASGAWHTRWVRLALMENAP